MNPQDTDKNTGEPNGADGESARPESAGPTLKKPADGKHAEAAEADPLVVVDETDYGTGESADADGDGEDETEPEPARESSGLLSSAAAVVAAGLGVIGLSGSWVGRIAAERQTLIGQIEATQERTAADQIAALYGDAWHATALVNGVFAMLAVIAGIAVLSLPRKPGWVRAFAVAGAALGGLGVLVAVGMYFDVIFSLPEAAGS
ncbi:hypothetical protein [Streptomyces sp. CAU 1734]|uniref:hypothetical protein n=1 Tax=Streptomyces sp. CAU 1734 TaxID=3140360 RepID=UPI0032602CCE